MKFVVILAWLVRLCIAFDISNPVFKGRFVHELSEGKGLDIQMDFESYPTTETTNYTVFVYDSSKTALKVQDEDKKKTDEYLCPEDSDICIRTVSSLPDGTSMVTSLLSVPRTAKLKVDAELSHVSFYYDQLTWGKQTASVALELMCSDSEGHHVSSSLYPGTNNPKVEIGWSSHAFCIGESQPSDDSNWGWFTWLFIMLVILFAGYVIASAWANVSRNGGHEFLNELVDSVVESATKLPGFVREVFAKVTGGGDRGGYSAV